ncbi:Phosphopantetheine attachment site [Micromonospora nigra]|uniref:Phosphopantetheine attachment site n=1 Tax=Micromonospora nigra TaxID=145857 RepID=A0A1C6RBX0_9ACTN|nr:condensation domain-containing protein [Micromonospora nigra]SCL14641.1 Phosphopantetheine attachment site [Micromonospora nigra]
MTVDAKPAAATTPTTATLCELFRVEIGTATCGPDDSFFRLGGSSLDAMRVVSRLHQRYHLPVTLADLFAHTSARSLAERLAVLATAAQPTRRRSISVTARRRRSGSPLSFSQRVFYDIDRATGGMSFFNGVDLLSFRGDLDPDALVGAVGDVVARQWALRTVVEDTGGVPAQRVVDRPARIRTVDLRGAGPAKLHKLIRREHLVGFDLHAETPARFTLVRTAEDAWQLVSCIHHIAYDGMSRGILVDEIAHAYAVRLGVGAARDPLASQYLDFAEWQADALTGERLAGHLGGLADLLGRPAPRLTGDSSPVRGHVVRTGHFEVPQATSAGLTALAAAHGVSFFSVLAAGLVGFAAKHTGERRQLVAMQVANRGWPGSDAIIGCFSNLLPVEVQVDPTASPAEQVVAAQRAVGRTLRHEEMPFERAVALLAENGRDLTALGHLPTLGLALQPDPRVVRELPGGTLTVEPSAEIGEQVDPTSFGLVLELWFDDGLRGITRHLVDSWPGDSFATAGRDLDAAFAELARPSPGAGNHQDAVGA